MSKRNATASWSGYSHQGQIGLLIALREIRKFKEDNELSKLETHFLEYESKEDVAIYCKEGSDKKYTSIHQVKAYYSEDSDKKHKYSKVLNNTFDGGCDNNFLHTAKEISDWETSSVENSNEIKRYLYKDDVFHCDTSMSKDYIVEELKAGCFKNGDEGSAIMALNRLSYNLDEKIRKEHQVQKRKEDYNVVFSFQEIENIINTEDEVKSRNIFIARKLFYLAFQSALKDEGFDAKQLKKIKKKILKSIYSLDDRGFLEFMKKLNLDGEFSAHEEPHIYYNKPGLQDVFFYILNSIKKLDPSNKDNSVVYKRDSDSTDYILTSINQKSDKKGIVKNIIKNAARMEILWENQQLINMHHTGKFTDLDPSIMNVNSQDEKGKNKFMSPSKKSGLLKGEEAKNRLNND